MGCRCWEIALGKWSESVFKYRKRFVLLSVLNGTSERNSASGTLPQEYFTSPCWVLDLLFTKFRWSFSNSTRHNNNHKKTIKRKKAPGKCSLDCRKLSHWGTEHYRTDCPDPLNFCNAKIIARSTNHFSCELGYNSYSTLCFNWFY